MDRRSSLTEAQRVLALGLFEEGMGSWAVATRLVAAPDPVKLLYQRWRIHGKGALVAQPGKRAFSFEFKLAVVERFLAGEPATELAAEHELSSPKLVKTWARRYRQEGADGLRPKPKGRPRKDPESAPPESELERLRRENELLKAKVAYLGKLKALREQQERR
ncbi:helix-turn-helix protein [Kribbella rubisoli]|jgi:transposase|uniref:Helix-turn-helix protein n=1 Tax=Kribbella rubisoli TaxID=3075929 RepID=A0A4Q7WZ01_9ACTN|nr:helix-turn-helix domain-containing protein [Kribbella rubisoli]RZU15443.1 helix-turn-helix protein [Kribbella rubisoli]